MKTKNAVQTEKKRLTLDDFKLEQIDQLGSVVAADLHALFGGGGTNISCPGPGGGSGSGGSQDDCHS